MIRVVTLPGIRVQAGAAEVSALEGRRLPLALLVYLAVERSVARDSVLAVFWPERDEERARHSLSQALYELRRDLGAEWLAGTGDVLAVAPAVQTDLAEFEAAVAGGRWAPALQLYGGAFLDGLSLVETKPFEEWVDRRRAQAGRAHRRARREVVAERLRAADVAGALAVAARWAEVEPLDDEAQQRCIELLARSGRRAEALREFELFEQRLREEELEPMPDLLELIRAIRAGPLEPAPGAPGAPARGAAAWPASAAPLVPVAPAPPAAVPVPPPATTEGLLPGLAPEYEAVRLLAEGRSSRIYLARERALTRFVAVKVLSPAAMHEPVLVRRFEREARALARVKHPNVAEIYRLGVLADGARYLVLPYIDGGSLEDRLAARGPLSSAEVRRVLAQLAAALAAAHAAGIVHRDVRPANVLFDRASERLRLVDFGTAGLLDTGDLSATPLTRPGEALGLPAYTSPEQLRGEPVTDRSDVYSLGVLAFEILTGRLPFEAKTLLEVTAAHLEAPPPTLATVRPDSDPQLTALVQRCLNKRPEQRPYAKEIAEALGH